MVGKAAALDATAEARKRSAKSARKARAPARRPCQVWTWKVWEAKLWEVKKARGREGGSMNSKPILGRSKGASGGSMLCT